MKLKKRVAFLLFFCIFKTSVLAQQSAGNSIEVDTGQTGLQPIKISFFPQIKLLDAQYASIFSWLSFLANLAILALVLFWIYKIIMAGVNAMRSGGEAEKLQESYKQIRSVFIGVALTLSIPIILTLIGVFIGVGRFWEWPLALRECKDPEYEYYFQALQAFSEEGNLENPKEYVDNICFN
jgi:hypothetical protein